MELVSNNDRTKNNSPHRVGCCRLATNLTHSGEARATNTVRLIVIESIIEINNSNR